ncbi:Terminase (plasmid) [Rhodovastum atsumiense]|uniref:Terminase n=1 Tax=Rhodovastum atsumiense TaxID=504468 RepID=A0A5M6IIJ3_9PROT|nr:prohead protease/major capsid protein fusion protein [Rhodovastum atsumiense]KAA5608081.1 terminase [Rhodovastum atsumiense]CAH2606535.1 Terminase [Rhodovastum atsumiense]
MSATTTAPLTVTRAISAPASVDAANRTVDVIWSTGARARNVVPGLGTITEELDMSPNACRMDRLASGRAPVLNTHRRGDARDIIGRVVSARIEGGRGIATIQFSSASDVEPIWQRVADGTATNISVGYRVARYDQVADQALGVVHRAVDWEPFEISIVPIPVDNGATVRGITETITEPPPAAGEPISADRSATDLFVEMNRAEAHRRADLDNAANAARALLPAATVDNLHQRAVAERWTPETLRTALMNSLTANSGPVICSANPSAHDPAITRMAQRDAMAEAIAARVTGAALSAGAKEFAGISWADAAREMIQGQSDVDRGFLRSADRVITRAMHTTSDFPILAGAVAGNIVRTGFQRAEAAIKQIARIRTDIPDFRTITITELAGVNRLDLVRESGEIKAGTAFEGKETYKVSTFGKLFHMSRELMVNDSTGALNAMAVLGAAAAETEAQELVALLAQNSGNGPTMSDGQPMFRTASNNLASTGTAIDLTNVAAARAAMRLQKDRGGNLVNLGDQVRILVAVNDELAARQMTIQTAVVTNAQENVFAPFIQPIVEPRLAGRAWYLFADPSVAPVIELAYLVGSNGVPSVEPFNAVDKLGYTFRVVHDFGVGAVSRVGCYKNPGVSA